MSEQRCRNLHEVHAPLVARGGKPRHVAHHPAAQGKDRTVPGEPVRDEHVQQPRHVGEGLVGLAVRQDGLDDAPSR